MSDDESTPEPAPPHPREPGWPIKEKIEALAREWYGDDLDPEWGLSDMLFIFMVDVADVYLQEIERMQPTPDLDDPSTFESSLLAGSAIGTVLNGLEDHLVERQEGIIERVP